MMNGSTNIKSLKKVTSKMQQIWTYNFNKRHYPLVLCRPFRPQMVHSTDKPNLE